MNETLVGAPLEERAVGRMCAARGAASIGDIVAAARGSRRPSAAWRQYQEDAATVIADLGFTTTTDVRVQGARYRHDVDVLATYERAGLQLMWVIECKRWRARVGKDRVLTLRGVVEDVGAEKGILLAENGFQAGALAMTENSNVDATSLDALRGHAADALLQRHLEALPARVAAASNRYWAMPKSFREDAGLRPEGAARGYSGGVILQFLPELVISGFSGVFPPRLSSGPDLPLHSREEVVRTVEGLLDDIESRMSAAEDAARPADLKAIAERARRRATLTALSERDALSLAMTLSVYLVLPPEEVAARFDLRISEFPAFPGSLA